jgi:hypothetical protein
MSLSDRSGAIFTSIGTRLPCLAGEFLLRVAQRTLTRRRSACSSCSSRSPAVFGEEMLTVT